MRNTASPLCWHFAQKVLCHFENFKQFSIKWNKIQSSEKGILEEITMSFGETKLSFFVNSWVNGLI